MIILLADNPLLWPGLSTDMCCGLLKPPLRSVRLVQLQSGLTCMAKRSANTAGECSATVAALVALVTPLPYSADFRPYFTIHDAAFARMAGGQLPCGANRLPRLLGITNLYILKVCLAAQMVRDVIHRRMHSKDIFLL